MRIDLNADVGESFGPWSLGEDETLIPVVTSVNVACGFHAGDPATIERTVTIAAAAGTAIGAHPGYADLAGFGRREMLFPPAELEADVLYQVAAVAGFARAVGSPLQHVKPHGALYNRAARDPAVAEAVARAVKRISAELVVVGLAGSVALEVARAEGLRVAAEAFADRAYEPDGSLRSRHEPGAVIDDPAACARQAVTLARDPDLRPDTICVHGDRAGATVRAIEVRAALEEAGFELRPVG